MDNYLTTNQKNWDNKVAFHYESDFYNVDSFIDEKTPFKFIEFEILGDISNQKKLHLQCHFG